MKKLSVIFAVIAIFGLAGCASSGGSSGGGSSSGSGAEPYSVDLSTLTAVKLSADEKSFTPTGEKVKNADPFTRNYDNLVILFPEQLPVDVTGYARVTIKAKYYNETGGEIAQGDGNAMVSLFYEPPPTNIFSDGHANVIIKEFNVGGFSGAVSTDRGVRLRMTKQPGGILLQCSNVGVKTIELTEITFHN